MMILDSGLLIGPPVDKEFLKRLKAYVVARSELVDT